MMENPIRRIRLSKGKTLHDFADDCGINYQALYLNECGVYPTVLPVLLEYIGKLGFDSESVAQEYKEFVLAKRLEFGACHSTTELPPPVGSLHPFVAFRQALELSRVAFAKSICVHPAGLYRLELGLMKHLPGDVREALTVAGFSINLIEELDYRVEEWNSGVWEIKVS